MTYVLAEGAKDVGYPSNSNSVKLNTLDGNGPMLSVLGSGAASAVLSESA